MSFSYSSESQKPAKGLHQWSHAQLQDHKKMRWLVLPGQGHTQMDKLYQKGKLDIFFIFLIALYGHYLTGCQYNYQTYKWIHLLFVACLPLGQIK